MIFMRCFKAKVVAAAVIASACSSTAPSQVPAEDFPSDIAMGFPHAAAKWSSNIPIQAASMKARNNWDIIARAISSRNIINDHNSLMMYFKASSISANRHDGYVSFTGMSTLVSGLRITYNLHDDLTRYVSLRYLADNTSVNDCIPYREADMSFHQNGALIRIPGSAYWTAAYDIGPNHASLDIDSSGCLMDIIIS